MQTVNDRYISAGKAALLADVTLDTLYRWYSWWENDNFPKPVGLELPKYYILDRRRTKFFKEDVSKLRKFAENVRGPYKGCMAEFNAALIWGKKGEIILKNKGTSKEEVKDFKIKRSISADDIIKKNQNVSNDVESKSLKEQVSTKQNIHVDETIKEEFEKPCKKLNVNACVEVDNRQVFMSKFFDGNITIYEALENIKNGKYVMPAFQRQYVWDMERIEKLWDSILLDYPVANFLMWNINDDNVSWDTYFCSFLTEVTFDSAKRPDSNNYELQHISLRTTDTAILDGQQRLTSLYLSLFGTAYIRQKHARKKSVGGTIAKLVIELDKNKLTVDEEEYNSKKFDVKFSDKIGKFSSTQFDIKEIMSGKFQNDDTRVQAIEDAIFKVPADSKEYARHILNKLYNKIFKEKIIRYTEIINMQQDDALEMFVRFNSGGKALRKHEIMMSILEAYWPNSKREFGELLVDSYSGFGTDFIMRAALMLYGDVTKSNINKEIAESLKNNWSELKKAFRNLEEVLKLIKVDVSRFSGSWNVLLPILYFIYNNPNYMNNIEGIRAYLVRAVLFTYFQSGTKGKLQRMQSYINSNNYEITIDMLEQITDMRVTDGKIDDIINSDQDSRIAKEALYFLGADWIDRNLKYEVDHLHPLDRFERTKPVHISMEDWHIWRSNRNRLPNLQLLEGRSNGSKKDISLEEYYNDMNNTQKAKFHKEALVPNDAPLNISMFGEFYEKRKALLTVKIRELLG